MFRYLKFRINRPTYWMLIAVAAALMFLLAYFGKRASVFEWALVLIGVPRLHDIGRTGWIMAGVIAAEIGVVVAAALSGGGAESINVAGGAFVVVTAVLAVWLGAIPGQPHPNKWGFPPASGISFGKPSADYGDTFG